MIVMIIIVMIIGVLRREQRDVLPGDRRASREPRVAPRGAGAGVGGNQRGSGQRGVCTFMVFP